MSDGGLLTGRADDGDVTGIEERFQRLDAVIAQDATQRYLPIQVIWSASVSDHHQISQFGRRSKTVPKPAITTPLVNFNQRPACSCSLLWLRVTTAIVTMRLSSKM